MPDGLCGGRISLAAFAALARLQWHLGTSAYLVESCLLMAVAMLPLVIEPLAHIRRRSFADRRALAFLLFASGYLAMWTIAGAAMHAIILLLRLAVFGRLPVFGIALLAALLWQAAPGKQICLNCCCRRPTLGAFGTALARDHSLYGMRQGAWCVAACGPLMLAAHAAGTGFGQAMAMSAVVAVAAAERFLPPARPAWRWGGSVSLAMRPRGRRKTTGGLAVPA